MKKKYFKSEVSDPPLIMEVEASGERIAEWAHDQGWEEIDADEYHELEKHHKMNSIADVVIPIPSKKE